MTLVTRRDFLVTTSASLIALPSLAIACDDNEKKNNPYRFTLAPGATMTIAVTFNSGWTNAMSLVDVAANTHWKDWPGCGNRPGYPTPKTYSYTNKSNVPMPFWISHGYKATEKDDPNKPWCKWDAIAKSYTSQSITLGCTDGTSGANRNNCVITLSLTSGELPKPVPVT